MYKIASVAVSFALLGATANAHLSNLSRAPASPASQHKTEAVQPKAPAQPAQPAPVMVTVQPGDSLTSIAGANGTTYVRIFDANEFLTDPDVITPGQQLRIPQADEQLPDRTPAPAPVVQTAAYTSTRAPSYTAAAYPVSGDSAKAFIYSHESGNNPNATSPNGCYGLGQDCNGRVRAQCGADYACQDQYFTNYAVSRYGGWDGAVAFWQTHGWW
jgi:LysM repeat protein